jgi:hypothetical protein
VSSSSMRPSAAASLDCNRTGQAAGEEGVSTSCVCPAQKRYQATNTIHAPFSSGRLGLQHNMAGSRGEGGGAFCVCVQLSRT